MLHIGRIGALSTLSHNRPGWPFGSLAPYALDQSGQPVFLLSAMAVHSRNLEADKRASLLVTQPGVISDPLGASRATLIGTVSAAGPEVREPYLNLHENAQYWAGFADFSFYRMEIAEVYFIGGFGVMGWVSAEEYRRAAPDPLADAAPVILECLNSGNRDELLLLARIFSGSEAHEAQAISIDKFGLNLRLKTGKRVHGTRIVFPREVRSGEEFHSVMGEMTRRADGGVL